MRRLLRSVGVEPKRPGTKLIEIEAPDLVISDWRAGLSCRAIAVKHGLVDHKPVARLLRSRGIDVQSRPVRCKVPAVVLGTAVTSRQAYLRRLPPMRIPVRPPEERRLRAWTSPELAAIEQALWASGVQHAPRGVRGLPEVVGGRLATARGGYFTGGRRQRINRPRWHEIIHVAARYIRLHITALDARSLISWLPLWECPRAMPACGCQQARRHPASPGRSARWRAATSKRKGGLQPPEMALGVLDQA